MSNTLDECEDLNTAQRWDLSDSTYWHVKKGNGQVIILNMYQPQRDKKNPGESKNYQSATKQNKIPFISSSSLKGFALLAADCL